MTINFDAPLDQVREQIARACADDPTIPRPDPRAPQRQSRVEHVFADDDDAWLDGLLRRWGWVPGCPR